MCACLMQADDGTFMEEPGSGAVASIGKKIVSVGSLEWVRRYFIYNHSAVVFEMTRSLLLMNFLTCLLWQQGFSSIPKYISC